MVWLYAGNVFHETKTSKLSYIWPKGNTLHYNLKTGRTRGQPDFYMMPLPE